MKGSRIQGQAVVIFGGQIGIRVGYDKQSGYCVLEFSELIGEHKAGDMLEKEWKDYGTQVQFAFRDLVSIGIVRNALDCVERTLKDGEIPEELEGWFTK